MITSRRDYLMRILEELGRLLSRLTFRRKRGDSDSSDLEAVVVGLHRLFNLDAEQMFLLNPEQHFEMLADDDAPEIARDKILLYAALNKEAGYIYTKQGNAAMARATLTIALRFTLRARKRYPTAGWPEFAPDINELLAALGGPPPDQEIANLIAETNG